MNKGTPRKIYCEICRKQVVNFHVSENDTYRTIRKGAKAAWGGNTCFCGYCARHLDENGMFPEEK